MSFKQAEIIKANPNFDWDMGKFEFYQGSNGTYVLQDMGDRVWVWVVETENLLGLIKEFKGLTFKEVKGMIT